MGVLLLALLVGLVAKAVTGDQTSAVLAAGLVVVGGFVLRSISDTLDAIGLARRKQRRRRRRPSRLAVEQAPDRRSSRRRAA